MSVLSAPSQVHSAAKIVRSAANWVRRLPLTLRRLRHTGILGAGELVTKSPLLRSRVFAGLAIGARTVLPLSLGKMAWIPARLAIGATIGVLPSHEPRLLD